MDRATLGNVPYADTGPFADCYLRAGVQSLDGWDCEVAAGTAFERLRSLYADERDRLDAYDGTELVEAWIEPVLDALGFATLSGTPLPDAEGVVDRLLFECADKRGAARRRRRAGDIRGAFTGASALLEPRGWGTGFGGGPDRERTDRDASQQLAYYLEQTPAELEWGILTDGRMWRLYPAGDGCQRYYEVDLPAVLTADDRQGFRYFYAFFRAGAFRRSGGPSFLETVRAESETAVGRLCATLQDDARDALLSLARGFHNADGLDVASEDAAFAALHDQSLVALYRLLVVLLVDARASIHPVVTGGDGGEDESVSPLDPTELRTDLYETVVGDGTIAEAYSEHSTRLYDRLAELYRLIDEGELDIPAYVGGLFDREGNAFLAEHAVSDRHLAAAVARLTTVETDDGEVLPVDYADLDARHLGSIYERLLDGSLRIAPEPYAAVEEDGVRVWKSAADVAPGEAVETVPEGGRYLVDDAGERKATGSYYTPEEIVTYVVRETLGPLVDGIEADLERRGLDLTDPRYFEAYYAAVRDLRILDPAMGDGRFLTKAVSYLTGRVLAVAREGARVDPPPAAVRRTIAGECVYGVDRDGMAVELATLAVWLETLPADRPPASLADHLETGDALVGSSVADVFGDADDELWGWGDESTDADGDRWADPSYGRLIELANVRTARRFGIDLPGDAAERAVAAVADDAAWAAIRKIDWFRRAQAAASAASFFHWELAFPEVFLDGDGRQSADGGFDAVVGNPPWVATAGRSGVSATMDRTLRSYLEAELTTTEGQFDLYVAFYERFLSLSRTGRTGIVVPDAILTREQNARLREHVLEATSLRRIVNLGPVFQGVENGAAVLITGSRDLDTVTGDGEVDPDAGDGDGEVDPDAGDGDSGPVARADDSGSGAGEVLCADTRGERRLAEIEYSAIPARVFRDEAASRFLLHLDDATRDVLATVDSYPALTDRIRISRGEEIGKRAAHLAETGRERHSEIVPGGAIRRYGLVDEEIRYVPDERIEKDAGTYQSPKLLFRQTSDSLVGTYDDAGRVTIKSAYNIHTGMDAGSTMQLLGVLNSTLLSYYHDRKYAAYRSVFPQINQSTFESLPVPRMEGCPELVELVDRRLDATATLARLDRSLLDHLGDYNEGKTLTDVGTARLLGGSVGSMLRRTAEACPSLRAGEATVERVSPDTVEIRLTARYRPDDGGTRPADDEPGRTRGGAEASETDRWGFAETGPSPALRVSDLTRTETALIEAFVPVAVDEADGFAGFRERATKTNSLLDRLRALRLPAVADVREDLRRYGETTARAAELEARIDRIDDRIDAIVYELYGLSDEQIAVVEKTVRD